MQKRHTDRKRYFEEQARTSLNYYIPYIKQFTGSLPSKVLEVGCGEGGNLLPFARQGCEVVGVDMAASRIEQARAFFALDGRKGTFIASDIFRMKHLEGTFPLVLVHDVIEHIGCKDRFLSDLRNYLSDGGVMFVAFPAWQMPFGGHQQTARGRFVSHCPFIHLLPAGCYQWLLRVSGESADTISELLDIRRTRCTVEMFRKLARRNGYRIVGERLYFVNPHYEAKFGMRPRRLSRMIAAIPYVRNFFCTGCFYLLEKE